MKARTAVDICVIYNPAAGRGQARRRLEELRHLLGERADFRPTQYAGHAEDLALEAAQAGFATVAAAGGDGTVHEVANGLLRAGRPEASLGIFPLGSANDYAHSLRWSSNYGPGQALPPRRVDVGLVRGENSRERYFVNSLGLGFPGVVTIESRRIRYLRGLALYGLGVLRALWYGYACPTMSISFDGTARHGPTFALNVAIGRREGNFVVAPQAELDDGLFDYLHVGCLSRWEVLRFLPRLAAGGRLPTDYPGIWQGRCREVTVASKTPLIVHLDGEFFCLPKNQVRSLDIRILPGFLRVQSVPDIGE